MASVRTQLRARRGGAGDARLLAVVTIRPGEQGRYYRLPIDQDFIAAQAAATELTHRGQDHTGPVSLVPDEAINLNEIRRISAPVYGMMTWGHLFAPRQLLALTTYARLLREMPLGSGGLPDDLAVAVRTCLAFNLDKLADLANSLCRWEPVAECPRQLFSRQAIAVTWDFSEGVPISESSGSWSILMDRLLDTMRVLGADWNVGTLQQADAADHPLPDDTADALITDPPYYDAVPYAHLSDFFYVWMRRTIAEVHPGLFKGKETPKDAEIVVDRPHELSTSKKDVVFYERALTRAFAEARRVLRPDRVGVIVFASKTTASWEAILQAVIDAGWILTGSWPIDTEMETRIAAQGQARLASSVHLVCRPRENPDGSLRAGSIGDWRDVLQDLPRRIHEWMPRLAGEGVVGADAIFACLGPALEVFSRYSRVEKPSGEEVKLRE